MGLPRDETVADDDVSEHVRAITRFLLSRGWKRYLGSHWFRPLPENGGRLGFSQEVFGLSGALRREMRKDLPEPPKGYDPPPTPPRRAA